MPFRLGSVAILVALSGLLLGFLPQRAQFEEEMGLALLYALRGPETPPDNVVIVGIDHESALRLRVPDEPQSWPRGLHAQIIRAAQKAGAAAVAFDIFFAGPAADPAADREMADAMRGMGSVVITDYVKPRLVYPGVYAESVIEPTEELAGAALAAAPFLLPKVSSGSSQFLTFFGGAEERATLPTVVLLAHVLRNRPEELLDALGGSDPEIASLISAHRLRPGTARYFDAVGKRLESVLRSHPERAASLLFQSEDRNLAESDRRLLRSLLRVCSNGAVRYFNHYGPAHTFATIPYHALADLSSDRLKTLLRGAIVLVGYLEDFQPENTEGLFYSPYSPISSVELAATAVANLLEDRSVQPAFSPLAEATACLFWGLLLGGVAQGSSARRGLVTIATLGCGYLLAAWWWFRGDGYWLPLMIPLGWQVPAAVVASLSLNYLRHARREEKMQSVIHRFIPVEVFSHLTRQEDHASLPAYGRLVRGVCLVTDAGRYTPLAETMEPMALARLMNQYYEVIFRPVTSRGGWISDVLGDAMMAIWIADNPAPACLDAVEAAAEILHAVRRFGQEHSIDFPIRIGIHCGDLRIGYVGTAERGEIRAVGDTVNTAARIEALNKPLGTQILISQAVLHEIPTLQTRAIGQFLLAGKSKPVAVAQLLVDDEMPRISGELNSRFAEALALVEAERWHEAYLAFTRLSLQFPQDGPIRFYCKRCRSYLANPRPGTASSGIPVGKPDPAQPLPK